MSLKILKDDNWIEIDGKITKNRNTFFAHIEVDACVELPDIIQNICGYIESIGNITLVNNRNISYEPSPENYNKSVFVYEAMYGITGYCRTSTILIKSLTLHYKELDYFFLKNKYKVDFRHLNRKFQVQQKDKYEVLYSDENYTIEHHKYGTFIKDKNNNKIFRTPSDIIVHFTNGVYLSNIEYEMNKIQNIFGLVLDTKLHLVDMSIIDCQLDKYDVFPIFLFEYDDVKLDFQCVSDLNSKNILKKLIKLYFTDKHVSSTINMYYEYLYNDLDSVFEFTSLVNVSELLLSSKFFKSSVIRYNAFKNDKLRSDNVKMKKIIDKLRSKDKKFVKGFYDFNKVYLKYKFNYIFYKYFKLPESDESNDYISKIVNTRNYYVHGSESKRMLNEVEIVVTNELLKCCLYVLIFSLCTSSINPIIDSCKLRIPKIYASMVPLK